MVKANKLPIIELRDPCKPKARAGENGFSFLSLIALYVRRFITDRLNSVMHGFVDGVVIMNEPRCIAQLLRNESPRAIDFTITHGKDARESLSAPKTESVKRL